MCTSNTRNRQPFTSYTCMHKIIAKFSLRKLSFEQSLQKNVPANNCDVKVVHTCIIYALYTL